MAYNPTNWQTGDTITAEKLNHAEQGITNSLECFVITVTFEDSTYTADKTYAEIKAAIDAGIPCIVYVVGENFKLMPFFIDGSYGDGDTVVYTAKTIFFGGTNNELAVYIYNFNPDNSVIAVTEYGTMAYTSEL